MATPTTQDKYVQKSCQEVMAQMKVMYNLYQRLKKELPKAKGSSRYKEYVYALEGLETYVSTYEHGGRFRIASYI